MYILVHRKRDGSTGGKLNASTPPHVHESFEEAKQEAERLAGLSVQNEFIVMKGGSISRTTQPPTPPVTTELLDPAAGV